jgi:hypothetical protein
MGVWAGAGGQRSGEAIRRLRDRLTGQPRERQHSARVARPEGEGGAEARDRTAPGEGCRFARNILLSNGPNVQSL